VLVIAAAIAASLVVALVVWQSRFVNGRSDSYLVRGIEGLGSLSAGDGFDIAAGSDAVLRIASIGEVTLKPGARGRVDEVGAHSHRLFLERGELHAKIRAAPRVFQIGTPAGITIDLGCEYDLAVDDDGTAHMHVRTGQVAFETKGRKVIVPKGASCDAKKDDVPNTPVMNDAPAAFVAAVRAVEFADEPAESDVRTVLEFDRREDSVSLWHLLDARSTRLREAVYDRLARTWPQPQGVTREGILAGDPAMRAAWRELVQRDWR
jgi:hypothetical protein